MEDEDSHESLNGTQQDKIHLGWWPELQSNGLRRKDGTDHMGFSLQGWCIALGKSITNVNYNNDHLGDWDEDSCRLGRVSCQLKTVPEWTLGSEQNQH